MTRGVSKHKGVKVSPISKLSRLWRREEQSNHGWLLGSAQVKRENVLRPQQVAGSRKERANGLIGLSKNATLARGSKDQQFTL